MSVKSNFTPKPLNLWATNKDIRESLGLTESPKKRCCRCVKLIDIKHFWNSSSSKDGLKPYCKSCARIYNKIYYSKESTKKRQHEYYLKWSLEKNPDVKRKIVLSEDERKERKRTANRNRQRRWRERQNIVHGK